MKKPVPVRGASGKAAVTSVSHDTGLSAERDCICETMKPHCPVHSQRKQVPAPGCDVIR